MKQRHINKKINGKVECNKRNIMPFAQNITKEKIWWTVNIDRILRDGQSDADDALRNIIFCANNFVVFVI